MNQPLQHLYSNIMSSVYYSEESKAWILPVNPFKEFFNNIPMYFSSKFAVHEFVYKQMLKEGLTK